MNWPYHTGKAMGANPSPSGKIHIYVFHVREAKLTIQMVACRRGFEINRQSVLIGHISAPSKQLGAGTSALMCGQGIQKVQDCRTPF